MSRIDTRTRTRPSQLLPDRQAGLDMVFLLVLVGLALSGLATSFTGWAFLVVGLVGAVLAVAVTHLSRVLGWPGVAPLLIVVVVFFALGGPLCLRATSDSAVLPVPRTLQGLVDQVLFGWKDLLTTLPPVDGDGPLLVLPWFLGLAGGLLAATLTEVHLRRAWLVAVLPVAGVTLLLVAVILLGVRHPQSLLLQGAAFAAVALGWLAVRARRAGASVRGGTSTWWRGVAGGVLVALAAGVALPASALVLGSDEDRVVLRTYVEPPFDIGRYPSPLASFRNYVDPQGRPLQGNLWDTELFTVDGAPAGTLVRVAALDRYDGLVWGASNGTEAGPGGDTFQRVSSTIDNPVRGDRVDVEITLGEGWNGVYLPTVGALQSMEFESGDPAGKAEAFRYNLATSTAVVPTGLRQGDRYRFTAVVPDDGLDDETVGATLATPAPAGTSFLDAPAVEWTEEAATPMGRVLAAAEHLRTEGRYSDGVIRSEQQYHPGHSLRRLNEEFVAAQQIVGNDEQYAATMALLAQKIGVPARVVLGATVPEGGAVTGKDVSAWVELQAADGTWRRLATDRFMSQEPPAEQQPETNEPMSGTVVPPPAPIPPPSDAGASADADLRQRKGERSDDEDESLVDRLPGWVRAVAVYVGTPLLLTALLLGSIVALKALRRRRRRRAAVVSARVVGGWRELVDHARDLGREVPAAPTTTRREQAAGLGLPDAALLARSADAHVFGPQAPTAEAAEEYWRHVDEARRSMSADVGRRRRLLAAVNPVSLRRRRRPAVVVPTPSAAPERGRRSLRLPRPALRRG